RALGQSETLVALAFDQRVRARERAHVHERAPEYGSAGIEREAGRRGEEGVRIPEDGDRPRLGIEELHAMPDFELIAGPVGGYFVISSSGGFFSARRIATMRVALRTVPAPTAISMSACASRAACTAACTFSSGAS